jgi:hypothetical protein
MEGTQGQRTDIHVLLAVLPPHPGDFPRKREEATMNETTVTLHLTADQAGALAQFVKRLDHDALIRYAHPTEKENTEKALYELATALKDAGFNPR